MKSTGYFDIVNCTTTAGVREAWGGVSKLLDDIGFAKTSDTGQMVVSSLAIPTAASYAAYEVRSFNDGLGAVFMKIEYASSTGLVRPLFRFTFGTGSDGIGNITGKFFDQLAGGDSNAHVINYRYQCWASLSNGTFTLALQGHHSNQGAAQTMWVVLDRERNPDTGAQVAGGWLVHLKSQGSAYGVRCYNASYQNAYPSVATSYAQATVHPGGGASGMYGETPLTGEVMPLLGVWPRPAVQPGIVHIWSAEMPIGFTFNVEIYGQVRTYISIAKGGIYTPLGITATGQANLGLAMIYE